MKPAPESSEPVRFPAVDAPPLFRATLILSTVFCFVIVASGLLLEKLFERLPTGIELLSGLTGVHG